MKHLMYVMKMNVQHFRRDFFDKPLLKCRLWFNAVVLGVETEKISKGELCATMGVVVSNDPQMLGLAIKVNNEILAICDIFKIIPEDTQMAVLLHHYMAGKITNQHIRELAERLVFSNPRRKMVLQTMKDLKDIKQETIDNHFKSSADYFAFTTWINQPNIDDLAERLDTRKHK